MDILISLLLAILLITYVVYPFLKRDKSGIKTGVVKIKSRSKNTTEEEIENRIQELRKKRGNYCSKCGTLNQLDARFCRQCGANLSGRKIGG
jgi:hypothetical protein